APPQSRPPRARRPPAVGTSPLAFAVAPARDLSLARCRRHRRDLSPASPSPPHGPLPPRRCHRRRQVVP
ncbi:hypothetical protein EE612_022094, partial [Oryza sativa]